MKRAGNWMEKWMLGADLPEENPEKLPLIEICGDRRVLIEHHDGVTEYGPEKICVQARKGQITVIGQGMKLCRMSERQLIISGKIRGVALNRG